MFSPSHHALAVLILVQWFANPLAVIVQQSTMKLKHKNGYMNSWWWWWRVRLSRCYTWTFEKYVEPANTRQMCEIWPQAKIGGSFFFWGGLTKYILDNISWTLFSCLRWGIEILAKNEYAAWPFLKFGKCSDCLYYECGDKNFSFSDENQTLLA